MTDQPIKTHTDGIWISMPREIAVIQQIIHAVEQQGFNIVRQDLNNYGYPYIFARDNVKLHCRFVDSVFLVDPDAQIIITDNIPLDHLAAKLISAVPEFWSIWHFEPDYQDREPVWAYNCFMNRPRGDRSTVFYELARRHILSKGLVSFNLADHEYQAQYVQADLVRYQPEHDQLSVPHNNLTGSLEQCIIDSNVSLVLETYVSDSHVVFSEKIFRCLQLPRPWLLYCSPQSVSNLRRYGFDVLDDYVDHGYDDVADHYSRLDQILNQLETFVDRKYSKQDLDRFDQAADHNQQLLVQFEQQWPAKLNHMLEQIQQL